MRNKYSINKAQAENFANNFNQLYDKFMDYGGVVFDDPDIISRVKKNLYACALCHNMNWEYLCQNVILRLYKDTKGFCYSSICDITPEKIGEYFKDYPKKYKIEAEVRCRMLIELSKYIDSIGDIFFNKILDTKCLLGSAGLNNLINTLPVFCEDPLHKKGNLLIQILLRENIVKVCDENNTEPAIDYHIIRFCLRFGFIIINDDDIKSRLSNCRYFFLNEITDLRRAISECMKYISHYSNVSISKLGHITWMIGRSYCNRDKADCERCVMTDMCEGYHNDAYRSLKEPVSNHGFY